MREPAAAIFDAAEAILQRVDDVLSRQRDGNRLVAERQLGLDVAAGEGCSRIVNFIGPDTASIGDCDVGADRFAHGVGNQIADCRFLRADGAAPAVEFGFGRPDFNIQLVRQKL